MSAGALREPWTDLARQREAATFGMWVFLVSELLFFSGMILVYSACRYLHPTGFFAAARETNVWYGTLNTMVLLTSSFAMAVAAQAGDARLRRLALFGLSGTVALGLAFLTIKGFEYRGDIREHLLPGPDFRVAGTGAQLFFSIYWVMTGIHAIHLSIGIVLVSRLIWETARRELPLSSPEIQATALYWHLVDIIWIVLYPLLYLGGRG
jgi:cytochrome c oxidase subunit III